MDLTQKNEALAEDLKKFIGKYELSDVRIYYNNKRIHYWREKKGIFYVEDIKPSKYFETADNTTVCVSFEGELYNIIYAYASKRKLKEFDGIFKKHHAEYIFGDAWNLSVEYYDPDTEMPIYADEEPDPELYKSNDSKLSKLYNQVDEIQAIEKEFVNTVLPKKEELIEKAFKKVNERFSNLLSKIDLSVPRHSILVNNHYYNIIDGLIIINYQKNEYIFDKEYQVGTSEYKLATEPVLFTVIDDLDKLESTVEQIEEERLSDILRGTQGYMSDINDKINKLESFLVEEEQV